MTAAGTRVVSLVPSTTETLLALGADVVACTRFCEQPQLIHVGGTKNPDIDAIMALEPDVVVLDREENRLEDHDELLRRGVPVFVSDVRTVDAALALVDELCTRFALTRPASFDGVVSAGAGAGSGSASRTAFVPIWRRPWMSINAATYGGSLLARLGVDLVTAGSESAYPVVELERMLPPDLVLVPSEPYDFTEAHVDELRVAFPGARVVRVDGQDLFWWGIRTPGAIRRLARVLDPSGAVGGDDVPALGE
jgi:ABC-type Fe3+-hydroxamate transport system substrate-binding protein